MNVFELWRAATRADPTHVHGGRRAGGAGGPCRAARENACRGLDRGKFSSPMAAISITVRVVCQRPECQSVM